MDSRKIADRMELSDLHAQKHSDGSSSPTSNQPHTRELTVAGLFAGIGGLEEGFRRTGHGSVMMCEADSWARKVLESRFPGVCLTSDVRELQALPECDVATAGFPCTDLSQVGRRRGIDGPDSGLITVVLDLLRKSRKPPTWLVLENVPFMLRLGKGRAIRSITAALDAMGWSWAYRTVDSRAFGLPQRRRRVILVASHDADPRPALFGEDAGTPLAHRRGNHACGFYWTEGNTGLGWAENAVPPLKGGSALHIPSPPAIWFPRRRAILVPDIRDAERLQGFEADWTRAAADELKGNRRRWRLVGNAVSVPVATWIARRLGATDSYRSELDDDFDASASWPDAAWGMNGTRARAKVSDRPVQQTGAHLAQFLEFPLRPLSYKATTGFLSRLECSNLSYEPDFLRDLRHHLRHEKSRARRSRSAGDQSANVRHSRAGQSLGTRASL